MTVGPGTYAHRYIPKRNALKQGSLNSASTLGNSSNSTGPAGHPYKRSQPGPSASTDPPRNIGANVSVSHILIFKVVEFPLCPIVDLGS